MTDDMSIKSGNRYEYCFPSSRVSKDGQTDGQAKSEK